MISVVLDFRGRTAVLKVEFNEDVDFSLELLAGFEDFWAVIGLEMEEYGGAFEVFGLKGTGKFGCLLPLIDEDDLPMGFASKALFELPSF